MASDHRAGPAQGRKQNLLMEVLPTAQCPEGESCNQETAGVSRTCWQGSGLEPGEDQRGGGGCQNLLFPSRFIFLRNVPTSKTGKQT